MTKEEARKKVRALKHLYMNALWFILGNSLFTFIWLLFDKGGTFWPQYIFIVWGTALIVEAFHENLLTFFLSRFSFLTLEWEDKKTHEMIEHHGQHRIQLNRYGKKES